MTSRLSAVVILALVLLLTPERTSADSIDVPFEKFVLDNGLRVIVHQDRKAPVVAVAVWYQVGSRDEPAGKTGYAHLFEHLMFEGTENYDSEFTAPFEAAGTIQQNGTTWFDRTNYFQTVPTPALDMALWMESERMGHLLGAITQEKLDQERAVVRNEKRESDNQPYGTVGYHILEGLFPPGHPYRHDTIGSMEDLEAASLEDMHLWFRQYYGASNAVLVMAGDISPENGLKLAERYFGDIEPGPPVARMKSWVPERLYDTHEVMFDQVPHTRVYLNWAVPGRTLKDRARLDLAARVLGSGKNSRLHKALVQETRYAVDVAANVEPHQLTSIFNITVTLAPDVALDSVMAIVDEELDRLFQLGPGEEELKRIRARHNATLARGLERVGGFSGKATILASGELYDGRPDFYQTYSAWINSAQTEEVREAAVRWLSAGRFRLDVIPAASFAAGESRVDRNLGVPRIGDLPDITFPAIQSTRLKNGLEVVLARRTAVPLVNIAIQFDAGYAADIGEAPGTSAFTTAMMDESTASRTALEVEALAESLGAEIETSVALDTSTIQLSALTTSLAGSVDLFADIVRNPAFAGDEIDGQKTRWLAAIESELNDPVGIALRILPPLLYGDDHAYGIPFTGSGTPEAIQGLRRSDLQRFYNLWFRPDNAKLFVVGDTSLDEIEPLLESAFGDWRAPRKSRPQKNIEDVPLPEESTIYLADRPGATQSLVMAAHLAPPTGAENNLEIVVMNDILGGSYNARVNQVIRIEKGWAYGAYTWLPDARAQRPWIIYASVQNDSTADAAAEMFDLINAYRESEPATAEELNRSIQSKTNSLPGRFETNGAVMSALLDNNSYARPDDYVATLKSRYLAVMLDAVQTNASDNLHPDQLIWVIVGDLNMIRPDIEALTRELELGEIRVLDIGSR
jgi:zinc protease